MENYQPTSYNKVKQYDGGVSSILEELLNQKEGFFSLYSAKEIIQKITVENTVMGRSMNISEFQLKYNTLICKLANQKLLEQWNKILQHTYTNTLYKKGYCPDAVKNFHKSLKNNTGIRVVDSLGNIFFRKNKGPKTILSLSNVGYGDRDDYTDLMVHVITPKQISEKSYIYEVPHKINFKQATKSIVGEHRFEKYPDIVKHLHEYSLIQFHQHKISSHITTDYILPELELFINYPPKEIEKLLEEDGDLATTYN